MPPEPPWPRQAQPWRRRAPRRMMTRQRAVRRKRPAAVWMRGRYRKNHGEWTTAVVALILPAGAG